MLALRFHQVGRRARVRLLVVLELLACMGLWAWGGLRLLADHQLAAARTALENRQFAEASRHADLALTFSPANPAALLLAARIERHTGRYKNAEEHLQTYKRNLGVTDEFQTEWILLRAQAGEAAQLEKSLWNCVTQDHPQTVEILETLTACFIRETRFRAALGCLEEWLKREPSSTIALQWRGMVREYLEARSDAVKDYQEVLRREPARWQVRLQLAQLLLDLTRFKEAGRELEMLRTEHGDLPPVQMSWGRLLFNQGKTAAARQVFADILATDPQHPLALLYAGKLETDAARAEQCFRKALQAQPSNLEIRFALYAALRQAGRDKEAAEELRLYQAARADADETKKLMERMEKAPNDPDVLARLGARLLDKFDNPQGLSLLFRALSFDSANARAHEALARYYERHNQPAEAAKHRDFSVAQAGS